MSIASATTQQGGAGQAGGKAPLTREEMWYAPTAEDWAKPCLINWQRNYEDATRVSEETGKPILVCVNMDGEIASEHYAGIRYRQQAIADLYEPYVTVIASVYRHTPRDYDDKGTRILCPRFGSVTCGEHIRIEPGLFEKFLDDTRVSPRHIMVENGKKEEYDVYYAFDTDSVFNTIREGIANRPPAEPTVERGDQSIVERVDSRDVLDRAAVEKTYQKGDRVIRRELLVQAGKAASLTQVDLLRLALFDTDAELSQLAWSSLVKTTSTEAIGLISEVLGFDLATDERTALIETLARIGETSPRAQRLAEVHKGLAGEPKGIDAESWAQALVNGPQETELTASYILNEGAELATISAEENPEDVGALLNLAVVLYDLASHPDTDSSLARSVMSEAWQAARSAQQLGADGWDVNSILAASAKAQGRNRQGYAAAVDAMANFPADPYSWRAKETLALFAEARQRAIFRALVRKTEWPVSWLSDAHVAFSLLSIHPYGTAQDVIAHHDYLKALEAKGYAQRTLTSSLERFPKSPLLHDRLRSRLLAEKELDGLAGLEATYEAMLRDQDPETLAVNSSLHWYAGYASFVAAEFHRRGGSPIQARSAYGRSIAHFENSQMANVEAQESASHYVALAHAGLARVAMEAQEFETAVNELLTCFEGSPMAGDNLDGLGITPVMTSTTLKARLQERGMLEAVAKVDAALAKLPPSVLEAPAFEAEAAGTGAAGRRDLRPGRNGRNRR
ncbi:MAG: hypothetical protein ACI8X5_002246 [Planctomycetota bacterium]|jgi:hypothetical protein